MQDMNRALQKTTNKGIIGFHGQLMFIFIEEIGSLRQTCNCIKRTLLNTRLALIKYNNSWVFLKNRNSICFFFCCCFEDTTNGVESSNLVKRITIQLHLFSCISYTSEGNE